MFDIPQLNNPPWITTSDVRARRHQAFQVGLSGLILTIEFERLLEGRPCLAEPPFGPIGETQVILDLRSVRDKGRRSLEFFDRPFTMVSSQSIVAGRIVSGTE